MEREKLMVTMAELLDDGHTQLEVTQLPTVDPATGTLRAVPEYRVRVVREEFAGGTLQSLAGIAERRSIGLSMSRVEGIVLD